jgi:hypothetical protein
MPQPFHLSNRGIAGARSNGGGPPLLYFGGKNKKQKLSVRRNLARVGAACLFLIVVGVRSRTAVRTTESAYNRHEQELPFGHPWRLPFDFDNALFRSREMQGICQAMDAKNFTGFDQSVKMMLSTNSKNETVPTLPTFGFLHDMEEWKRHGPSKQQLSRANNKEDPLKWQCSLPKWKECMERNFTVILMAHNLDRLKTLFAQIQKMLTDTDFKQLVAEVVLVWNGPRQIDESPVGNDLLTWAKQHDQLLRVVYPLAMGFDNDLMNRYHPDIVNVTTKAILYYDDDGPFYSFKAIQSGFELWKRHSSAQIGAMARQINYSGRQQAERDKLSPRPNDRLFVSHCDNVQDKVEYNFRYFANYDASKYSSLYDE